MDNKYNIAIVLVFLIIAFIIIISLTGKDMQTSTQTNTNQENVRKTCQEMCKTENCIYGCYTTLINIAVAEKSLSKCNNINEGNVKQSCLDQVNLALKNCDKIVNENLRALC